MFEDEFENEFEGQVDEYKATEIENQVQWFSVDVERIDWLRILY